MRRLMTTFAALALASLGMPAAAQTYPDRPIAMLGPAAGGGADLLMRLVAEGLSKELGQTIVVENRQGSIGISEFVANADPDGYTLLFYSSSAWVQPLLGDMDFDPEAVFAPISLVLSSPGVLAVNPKLGVKTTAEFLEYARANPGKLNFAGGGFGSANHLSGELFKSLAGIEMTYVPYRGSGPALTGAVAGEVDALFSSVTSVRPFAENGDLIALGVTKAKATELAPNWPPLAQDVPGYDSSVDFVILGKVGTPPEVLDRISAAVQAFINDPAYKELFLNQGTEPVGSTAAEAAAFMKTDIVTLTKVIEAGGLKTKK